MERGYTEKDRLRSYASVFSRRTFTEMLNHSDFVRMATLYNRYDVGLKGVSDYVQYLEYMYSELQQHYRCEYVYKNEIVGQLFVNKYGTKNSLAVNEFRIGKSIVDLALFNGESRAFEIKTELDTNRRLCGQLRDYCQIFQRCYVVVPENEVIEYREELAKSIGILTIRFHGGGVTLDECRPASLNTEEVDAHALIRCIRAAEYKAIVEEYFGELPRVSNVEMFARCEALMAEIPREVLNQLFLGQMKKRRSATPHLGAAHPAIRQAVLALHVDAADVEALMSNMRNLTLS